MGKYTVFKISNDDFGIAIENVVEILKVQKVFFVPGLPGFLTGVMSVRGSVVPLIDLRRRFGVRPSGKKERIIIVRFEMEKIGFLVDEMKEIISLSEDEITGPPSIFRGFKTEYMRGLGKKDERIIILLNVENLLTSEEKIILKDAIVSLEEKGAELSDSTKRQ